MIRNFDSLRDEFHRAGKRIFGDRIGLLLFLGTVIFISVTWRVGFLINDNYALANGVVALRDGSLFLTEIRFGPDHGMTPGVRYGDGYLYSRHYGMLFLALPIVFVLEGLALVADLRVAIGAIWSLTIVLFGIHLGKLVGTERLGVLGGCTVGVAGFLGNLHLSTALDPEWIPMLALQIQTIVAAGMIAVVTYRFVASVSDRTVGGIAGAIVVIGTPVGFWAPIPKRHVLVGLLALVAIFLFYVSRQSPDGGRPERMGMYGLVALSAWVSPAEGLVLFAVITPIDLATAPSNRPRDLALVAGTFGIALVPFLATNFLITGNPLIPPRMLPAYRGQTPIFAGELATSMFVGDGPIDGSGPPGPSEIGSPSGWAAVPIVGRILEIGTLLLVGVPNRLLDLLEYLTRGVIASAADPDRLVRIFVHGGYMPDVAGRDGGEAVTLSLLESMPIVASLLLVPIMTASRSLPRIRDWLTTPRGQTDLVAGGYIVVLTLLYLHRLPTHATVTLRYMVPAMPVLLYLVFRLPPVRAAVRDRWQFIGWTVAAVLLIGGQILVIILVTTGATLGEAVQLHARLSLFTAVLIAGWVVAPNRSERPTVGAILIGTAAGLTGIFLLLSSWELFWYAGPHALPLAEWIASIVRFG